MIKLAAVYTLVGLLFAVVAVASLRDGSNPKRWKNTLFWGGLALSFLAGDHLGDFGNGLLVLFLAALAGFGGLGHGKPQTTTGEERQASALRWGNRLFIPTLIIPGVALLGALVLKDITVGGAPLLEPKNATLLSLAIGVLPALSTAMVMLRPQPSAPVEEARRLLDSIGWAAVLPQMLASLGAVFALAGVGDVIGDLARQAIPDDSRFLVVAAYTVGMALFTMVMGNAFAAFPVMTVGVALPLIVGHYGGNPVIVGAIGMLSGFCGTLMTPMAANFNIVPAALLELPDRNGVIKAQIPTALILLLVNTVLMYVLAFRF